MLLLVQQIVFYLMYLKHLPKIILVLFLVLVQLPSAAFAAPAFPGAEGFGAKATGGRGGKVIHVNTLEDVVNPSDGKTSFREAVMESGKRIVVFDVGGVIHLKSPLVFGNNDLTIAGETAPGNGILVRGELVRANSDNLIIRHMRFRTGTGAAKPDGADGLFLTGDNVIVDHTSVSWAIDENMPIYGKNVTIQWTFITEGLFDVERLDGENHSKGAFFAYGADFISFHHNLLANNNDRNPYSKSGRVDVINNVIYNKGHGTLTSWGGFSSYRPPSGNDRGNPHEKDVPPRWNFIKNYIKLGPDFLWDKKANDYSWANEGLRLMDPNHSNNPNWPGDYYMEGYVEGNLHRARPDNSMPDYLTITKSSERSKLVSQRYSWGAYGRNPYPGETDAQTAFDQVLAQGGATVPKRDSVDDRVVGEVKSGDKWFGKDASRKSGTNLDWPNMPSTTRPSNYDSDRDGMADSWEKTYCVNNKCLNPSDGSDGNGDLDGDGYTNVEEFLHSLANKNYIPPTIPQDPGTTPPTAPPTAPATQAPTNPPNQPIPGDANNDKLVDDKDLSIWKNNYNKTTTNGAKNGDFNKDGTVNGIDYVIWLINNKS